MLRTLAVVPLLALVAALGLALPAPVESACCYFSAKDKDVLQPAQKAFITWDPAEEVESRRSAHTRRDAVSCSFGRRSSGWTLLRIVVIRRNIA